MSVKQDPCRLVSSPARYSESVKVRWDQRFLCRRTPPETSTLFETSSNLHFSHNTPHQILIIKSHECSCLFDAQDTDDDENHGIIPNTSNEVKEKQGNPQKNHRYVLLHGRYLSLWHMNKLTTHYESIGVVTPCSRAGVIRDNIIGEIMAQDFTVIMCGTNNVAKD